VLVLIFVSPKGGLAIEAPGQSIQS